MDKLVKAAEQLIAAAMEEYPDPNDLPEKISKELLDLGEALATLSRSKAGGLGDFVTPVDRTLH